MLPLLLVSSLDPVLVVLGDLKFRPLTPAAILFFPHSAPLRTYVDKTFGLLYACMLILLSPPALRSAAARYRRHPLVIATRRRLSDSYFLYLTDRRHLLLSKNSSPVEHPSWSPYAHFPSCPIRDLANPCSLPPVYPHGPLSITRLLSLGSLLCPFLPP